MKNPRQPTDSVPKDLLDRLIQGQEEAAADLYAIYAHRICGLIRSRCSTLLTPRLDPDDVMQSVFRVFFESVRRGVYDIPDSESLWNLLAVIALNKLRTAHAFHHAARRDVRTTTPLPEAGVVDGLLSPDLLAVDLRDVLEQLPVSTRTVVQLRLNGYEVTEIAEQLNLSRRSVERLLQSSRQSLQVLLHLQEESDA